MEDIPVAHDEPSSVHRVLSIPELLEMVLLHLLDRECQDDDRHMTIRYNSRLFKQVLATSSVCSAFRLTILKSVRLRRRLFLEPDPCPLRSWLYEPLDALPVVLQPFYRLEGVGTLPYLNPLIPAELSELPFRFWHHSAGEHEQKHCAFMIVSRDGLSRFRRTHLSEHGNTVVPQMLLSQPPCNRMECVVFEDRDETRDYVGRTTDIEGALIESDTGLTIGRICSELQRIFQRHNDIARIKLTTV